MCLMFAISMCLREKYLAKTKTKAIFASSDGSTENAPMRSQLEAPLVSPPNAKRKIKRAFMKK